MLLPQPDGPVSDELACGEVERRAVERDHAAGVEALRDVAEGDVCAAHRGLTQYSTRRVTPFAVTVTRNVSLKPFEAAGQIA